MTEHTTIKPIGCVRDRLEPIARPKLWVAPPSMNSRKALVALYASTVKDFEIKIILIDGSNYHPDYVNINPLMAVPCLEIDKVIINDSLEIIRYLRKHHHQTPTSPEVDAFVDQVAGWEEAVWCYCQPLIARFSGFAESCRMYWLRRYRTEADPALVPVYDWKITQMSNFAAANSAGTQGQIYAKADEDLEGIMETAQKLLVTRGGPFLFGDTYTDADTIMAPVIQRLEGFFPSRLALYYEKHDKLAQYAEVLKEQKCCQDGCFGISAADIAPASIKNLMSYGLFHTYVGELLCATAVVGVAALAHEWWWTTK
jgi:glutathione S-transferase